MFKRSIRGIKTPAGQVVPSSVDNLENIGLVVDKANIESDTLRYLISSKVSNYFTTTSC